MRTSRLIIGIISIVLFGLIIFQSCAVGAANALEGNEEVSGSAGLLLAICMLIAGIVGIVTRNKGKGGPITAGIFYLVGGLLGITNVGSFADLQIWSILSILFAGVYIVGAIRQKHA